MTIDELLAVLQKWHDEGRGHRPVWVNDTSDAGRPELVVGAEIDSDGDAQLNV